MQVGEDLRTYVTDKVEHLGRYFDGIVGVEVILDTQRERHICELVAHLVRKKIVIATGQADDIYAAVDRSVDKLKRQLRRHKGRLREARRGTNAGRTELEGSAEMNENEHPSNNRLLRTQVLVTKPMTPEEAIIRLETEGNDLLVFMDAERESLSILRRLADGRYELIEPTY
jgi:putative sigma-54 modulation protein